MLSAFIRDDRIRKRRGVIYIDEGFFEDSRAGILAALFCKFWPISAKSCYDTGKIEYMGFSYSFDECPTGIRLPVYNVEITTSVEQHNNGVVLDVNFIKTEDAKLLYQEEVMPDELFKIR